MSKIIIIDILLYALFFTEGVLVGNLIPNGAILEEKCLEKSGTYHKGKCFKEEMK